MIAWRNGIKYDAFPLFVNSTRIIATPWLLKVYVTKMDLNSFQMDVVSMATWQGFCVRIFYAVCKRYDTNVNSVVN